ncbi:MAG: sugar kinase [Planctomycetes bacterium]|nr:sugar kinase [Planctomycetota bacterium]
MSSALVPDFSKLRVAVVGDLVADHYLFGEPTRLSREAPVMVLRHRGEEFGAGGAANAARNLRSLGAEVHALGIVGRDKQGRELIERLERDGIDVRGVEPTAEWLTPTKTRILGAEPGRTRQHVLRIDREPEGAPSKDVRARLAGRLEALGGELDALLFSDYGYGLLADELGEVGRELARRGKVVVLDPRRTFEPFRGLSAITPNLGELALAARRTPEELDAVPTIAAAAREVLERCAPRYLLVTLGNRGMQLFPRTGVPMSVAAAGHEAVDVSGAGDTAAAAFTLALAAGLEGSAAMRLANAAAGVVVLEQGAAACRLDQLRSALGVSPLPRAGEPLKA